MVKTQECTGLSGEHGADFHVLQMVILTSPQNNAGISVAPLPPLLIQEGCLAEGVQYCLHYSAAELLYQGMR